MWRPDRVARLLPSQREWRRRIAAAELSQGSAPLRRAAQECVPAVGYDFEGADLQPSSDFGREACLPQEAFRRGDFGYPSGRGGIFGKILEGTGGFGLPSEKLGGRVQRY